MNKPTSSKQFSKKTNELLEKLEGLNSDVEKYVSSALTIAEALEAEKNKQPYAGLNFTTVRDALYDLAANRDRDWIPTMIATHGSGPWDLNEFDNFLMSREITLFEMPNPAITGLILGANDWSGIELAEQLYEKNLNSLKIYTQELFFLGLIAGRDPYDFLEQEVIDEVGKNHPAIQFILNQNFEWPWSENSNYSESDEDWEIDNTDWSSESVLKLMGYNASASGPDGVTRRYILKQVFEAENLPGIKTLEQRKRWGLSKSQKRLYSISHFLGWLINLQGSEKPSAKEKWLSDINWLKQEYYDRNMQFQWPKLAENSSRAKLDPQTAWPFLPSKSTSKKNETASNYSVGSNLLKPKHALAMIIGNKARSSISSAVLDLTNYIAKEKLNVNDSKYIESNDLLFALTGQMRFRKDEIEEIVSKNLTL